MREITIMQETYDFLCQHCGHEWEHELEARHTTDAEGDEVIFYKLDGVPVPAPWTGWAQHAVSTMRCPSCGDYNVVMGPNHRSVHEVDVAVATASMPHQREAD